LGIYPIGESRALPDARRSLLDSAPSADDVRHIGAIVSPSDTDDARLSMADDELRWIEAALGAVSKLNVDETQHDLEGARCPKCNASNFVKVSDAYSESVGRLEDGEDPNAIRDGGMTDAQIVAKFRPPRRKSAFTLTVAVALIAGGGAYYTYRRFGDNAGQIAGMIAGVLTVIVLMTTIRRLSDQYYHRRTRWNKLFMCRQCGQIVAG
jgi:hypothetical protein